MTTEINNLRTTDRYNDKWFTYYRGYVYKNRITDINTAINNKVIIDKMHLSRLTATNGVEQDNTGKLIRTIYN